MEQVKRRSLHKARSSVTLWTKGDRLYGELMHEGDLYRVQFKDTANRMTFVQNHSVDHTWLATTAMEYAPYFAGQERHWEASAVHAHSDKLGTNPPAIPDALLFIRWDGESIGEVSMLHGQTMTAFKPTKTPSGAAYKGNVR